MITGRRLLPFLLPVLRVLIGGTMVWAGLAKIPEPGLFAQTVRAYDVLPLAAVNPFAVVVPWIELAVGGCLALGLWTRSSAVVALLLLLSFAVALGINIHRGADLSCGCFGLDGTQGSLYHTLIRDVLLMLAALLLILARATPLSVDRLLSQDSPVASKDLC